MHVQENKTKFRSISMKAQQKILLATCALAVLSACSTLHQSWHQPRHLSQ
jgi:uncharacterized lipoprotein